MTEQTTLPVEHPRVDPASKEGRTARPVRARLTRVSALVTVLGLALLFGPWVAAAVGTRSTGAFENRKLATAPALTSGWRFFPRLTTWSDDNFPLKDDAVRLESRLSLDLFGQLPRFGIGAGDSGVPIGPHSGGAAPPRQTRNGAVIFGKKGSLFLSLDFERACHPSMTPAHIVRNLSRFAAIVARAGGRLIDTVVPDKTAIEPGLLPVSSPEQSCGRSGQLAFWSAITSRPPSGYFDAYDAVRSYASTAHAQAYAPLDTHWLPRVSAVYAFGLARLLAPRLLEDTKLVYTGQVTALGDLSRLAGDPRDDVYDNYAVRRTGEGPVSIRSGRAGKLSVEIYSASSTKAPLEAGQAVVFGDSFSRVSAQMLTPFFSRLVMSTAGPADGDVADTAKLIVQSRVVIFEGVERALGTGWVARLSDKYLNELSAAVNADLAARR